MADPSNVSIVQRFFAAFRDQDLPTVRAVLAQDVVFHVPGNSQISGDYRGVDQVLGFFGKVRELSGGTFRPEVKNILGNGDKVLVFQQVSGTRGDKHLEMQGAFVVHLAGGQWREVWAFHFDESQADRFWS